MYKVQSQICCTANLALHRKYCQLDLMHAGRSGCLESLLRNAEGIGCDHLSRATTRGGDFYYVSLGVKQSCVKTQHKNAAVVPQLGPERTTLPDDPVF